MEETFQCGTNSVKDVRVTWKMFGSDRSRKIGKETFWAYTSKIIFMLAGFFFVVFIPKFAGKATYGRFSLFMAMIVLAMVFFGNSISSAIKREIASNKISRVSTSYIIHGLKLEILIITLMGILLAILIQSTQVSLIKDNLLLFVMLLVSRLLFRFVNACIEAWHRIYYITVLYIVEYSITILLLLLFAYTGLLGFNTIIVGFIAGYVASTIYGLAVLAKHFQIFRRFSRTMDFKTSKRILSRSFFLSLTGLSFILLTRTDVFMLQYFVDFEQLGLYGIAADVAKPLTSLTLPIIMGVVPVLVQSKTRKIFLNYFILVAVANVALGGVIFVLSPFAIEMIYGAGYQGVTSILRILAFFPLLAVMQSFVQQTLIVKDRTKVIFISASIAALLNIVLNFRLIKIYGLEGAAIATLVSYAVWVGIIFIYLYLRYDT